MKNNLQNMFTLSLDLVKKEIILLIWHLVGEESSLD